MSVITISRQFGSQGDEIEYGDTGRMLKVQNIEYFDPTGWDMALFAIGSEATKVYAPKFAAAGCTVIDNSSLYRMDPDVPLIVPEVNAAAIAGFNKKNIIANPNCSTAQMVVALKPLHDAAKIKRVVVATYQSVSGAGKAGMDELFEQSRNIFVGDPAEPKKFTKQIAFNVIPHIDSFLDDGSTKEEWKMVVETKKILDPAIAVHATCVRVPVLNGHSEAVNVQTREAISPERARERDEAVGLHLLGERDELVDRLRDGVALLGEEALPVDDDPRVVVHRDEVLLPVVTGRGRLVGVREVAPDLRPDIADVGREALVGEEAHPVAGEPGEDVVRRPLTGLVGEVLEDGAAFEHADRLAGADRLQQRLHAVPALQELARDAGLPEDVAWMVASLVSPHASWVTGQTIPVNGGYNFAL